MTDKPIITNIKDLEEYLKYLLIWEANNNGKIRQTIRTFL